VYLRKCVVPVITLFFFMIMFNLSLPFMAGNESVSLHKAYATEEVQSEKPTEEVKVEVKEGVSGLNLYLKGLWACLTIAFTAFGTAWAQSKVGTAGGGAIAEKPEAGGTFIVMIAIPETMVILGFVIAAMILLT
jgi:V/A-type H+-transporting ATPase subunit K